MKITTLGYQFGDGCLWRVVKPDEPQKSSKTQKKGAGAQKHSTKPSPDTHQDKSKWWDR